MSLVVETRLILLEDLPALLFVQGCPVSRWMFSEPDLLQIVLLFHLRSVIYFSTILGVTSFAEPVES